MYDTKIGVSWFYFNMYFEKFTNFEIVLKRKQTQFKGKMFEQFIIKEKNGRTKAVYLKDKRTGNEIPLSIGLIYKHIYANFNLKSWTIYMSKLCNQNINFPVINLEKFHEEIIKKEIDKNFKELRDIFLIDHS